MRYNKKRVAFWMQIFTVEQAAKYLQVHEQTVYKLVRSGEITAKKVGKDWRIHRDILDAYVKGEVPGETEEK
jgi:excisionase family DNA binding protein